MIRLDVGFGAFVDSPRVPSSPKFPAGSFRKRTPLHFEFHRRSIHPA